MVKIVLAGPGANRSRLFPDCQNVSGIGLLTKKACLFCLLNQSDLETFVIKQKTWYFLLNTQKRAPLLFNKQILLIKQKSCPFRLNKQNCHYTTIATNSFSQPPLREKLCKAERMLLQHLCTRIVFC